MSMNEGSSYRLSPKKVQAQYRPHKVVYNAFSRPSSLQMSMQQSDDYISVYMMRQIDSTKKGSRLRRAIYDMATNPQMLRALLSDALGHAAVKGAEDRFGLGWRVYDLEVSLPQLQKNLTGISGVARLKRFIA